MNEPLPANCCCGGGRNCPSHPPKPAPSPETDGMIVGFWNGTVQIDCVMPEDCRRIERQRDEARRELAEVTRQLNDLREEARDRAWERDTRD